MRLVGPAVKHLIQQYGINSSKLPAGTGRNGVVLKGDILKYVQDNKLQAVKGKLNYKYLFTMLNEKANLQFDL